MKTKTFCITATVKIYVDMLPEPDLDRWKLLVEKAINGAIKRPRIGFSSVTKISQKEGGFVLAK